MSPRQMTLPLAFRPAMGRPDFLVADCNQAAFDAVTLPMARFAISGPEGSGKTHLASVWGQMQDAVLLEAAHLTDERIAELPEVPAVVIENADHLVDRDHERLLFHALNLTAAEGTALLLTGRTPPGRWDVQTPDLASRLAALAHVAIAPPDDTLLSSILTKLFTDRRLTAGPDVVKFLVRRMDRSFAAAEQVVDALDRMALAGRRPITRPLAMELFGDGPDPSGTKGT